MLFVPQSTSPLDGITFAPNPGRLLAPLRKACESLGLPVRFVEGELTVDGQPVDMDGPILADGTRLIPVRDLAQWGVAVTWDKSTRTAHLSREGEAVDVRLGEKRVTIDKTTQRLRAIQGNAVVVDARVSTGREGKRTPNGTFAAGPYKARMHRSSLYNDAPMPYSVQIVGNIFVHGYATVPNAPASNGCIRLPNDGPAETFFRWVEIGTPIEIVGSWKR